VEWEEITHRVATKTVMSSLVVRAGLFLLLQLAHVSALQLTTLPQPAVQLQHRGPLAVHTHAYARCVPVCASAEEGLPTEGKSEEEVASEPAAEIEPEAEDVKAKAKAEKKAEKQVLKDRINELERELKDARGQLLATQDELADVGEKGYLLLAANFERYRLKSRDELDGQTGTGKLAAMRVMLPFIETFDGLQAASDSTTDDEAVIHKYYGGIHKQLTAVVDSMQLEAFEATEGDKFDFLRHTQSAQRSSETVAEGCIVESLKKGYTTADGLVRTAEVVVSTGPEKVEEAPIEAAEEAPIEAAEGATSEETAEAGA